MDLTKLLLKIRLSSKLSKVLIINWKLFILHFYSELISDSSAVNAVLGGIIAQEIIKVK